MKTLPKLLFITAFLFWNFLLYNCASSNSSSPSGPANTNELVPNNIVQAETFWNWLHNQMEAVYDGNGEWSHSKTGCRLPLRSVYWKLDSYSRLSGSGNSNKTVYLQRADEALSWLNNDAQAKGSNGCYGIPDEPSMPEFGTKIQEIEAAFPQGITNGWIVSLPSSNIDELYYDHGRSLAAAARVYLRITNASLLSNIIKAADWCLNKPGGLNVNYLSSLIEGLAYAYLATNIPAYLDKAADLETNFVFPERQSDGSYCHDGHNEMVRYHSFILEGHLAFRKALSNNASLISILNDHIASSRAYLQIKTLNDNSLADTEGYCIASKTYTEIADLAGEGKTAPLSGQEIKSFENCLNKVIACRSAIETNTDAYITEKYFWHCCQIGIAVARYYYGIK